MLVACFRGISVGTKVLSFTPEGNALATLGSWFD